MAPVLVSGAEMRHDSVSRHIKLWILVLQLCMSSRDVLLTSGKLLVLVCTIFVQLREAVVTHFYMLLINVFSFYDLLDII